MHSLDLDTAVRLATIELRSKDEARSGAKINPVQQSEEEEDVVEAVTQNRPQKKFYPQSQQNRGQQQRQNSRPPQSNNYRNNQQQWRSNNPGNNSNKNNKTCSFCRRLGHCQEECRKRMNANQPASTPMVRLFGQRSIPLMPGPRSNPSRSRIFSSELDGTPTSSSCRHSSVDYEFVRCFYRDLQ